MSARNLPIAPRVLVLGLGSIGRRHVNNLRQLGVTRFISVRSGLGRSAETLPDVREVPDLAGALAMRPDFAVICNPTRLHVPTARDVARAGCPFLLEKPISDSMEGVDELAALVRERQLWTVVGFNLRFHPALRAAKELIQSGRIGRPLHIRAEVGQFLPDWHPDENYRLGYSAQSGLGGGVVLDLIHEMDYATWLAGGRPPRSVVCVADRVSSLEIDTEDVAELIVRWDDGIVGSIHMNYLDRTPHRAFRVIGEAGTLAGDLLTNELRYFDAATKSWSHMALGAFDRNDMYLDEMRHVLDVATQAAQPVVDLAAAIPVHAATVEALRTCRATRERSAPDR